MIKKKLFELGINDVWPIRNEGHEMIFFSIPHHRNIKKMVKDWGITITHKSSHTLKALLGNPKDELHGFEKSGICKI